MESFDSLADSSPEISGIDADVAQIDDAGQIDDVAQFDEPNSQSDAADEIAESKDSEKKMAGGLLADFNIFNAMMTASLLFILLATFLLFWELAGYGGLDGSWRTGSVGR